MIFIDPQSYSPYIFGMKTSTWNSYCLEFSLRCPMHVIIPRRTLERHFFRIGIRFIYRPQGDVQLENNGDRTGKFEVFQLIGNDCIAKVQYTLWISYVLCLKQLKIKMSSVYFLQGLHQPWNFWIVNNLFENLLPVLGS